MDEFKSSKMQIESLQNFTAVIDSIKKSIDACVTSDGQLDGPNANIMTKLENLTKENLSFESKYRDRIKDLEK